MLRRWYRNTVSYSLDVATFQDSGSSASCTPGASARRSAPGEHETVDGTPPQVLVHIVTGARGRTVFLHNLADRPCRISLDPALATGGPLSLAADKESPGRSTSPRST